MIVYVLRWISYGWLLGAPSWLLDWLRNMGPCDLRHHFDIKIHGCKRKSTEDAIGRFHFPVVKGHCTHEPRIVTMKLLGALDSHPKAVPLTWYVGILRHAHLFEPMRILVYRKIIIYKFSCRNPCKLFICDKDFWPLGLHRLVWSGIGWSPPFQSTIDNAHGPWVLCVKGFQYV